MGSLQAWGVAASALSLCVSSSMAQNRSAERADTVVRAAPQPVHPGVATLVEELSIGVADGTEEYILGEIGDVALGRDGSLYVYDGQVPIVRHYDANGKFLRSIGRRGSGPGEYRSVSGIATTPDGRLLVWDTGNWRVNVYAASGDFVTQWLTPSGMSGGGTAQYSRALMVDSAGRVVTRKQVFNIRDIENRPTLWLRFRPDGTPLDTIHEPPMPDPGRLVARADRVSTTNGVPFAPKRLMTMSPLGYLVTGYPNRYAFEMHQPGHSLVSVRRDVKADQVTRAERREARERIEERMRQTDPAWSWNGPDIPDTKPLYHTINMGLDGRVWIGLTPEAGPRIGGLSGTSGAGQGAPRTARPTADRGPSQPTLYDVFEPDGRYLGQVQLPAGFSAAARKGDQVWGVALGDDDVPRLKRYRIAWRR
jgi:hypothetical protein